MKFSSQTAVLSESKSLESFSVNDKANILTISKYN